MAVKKSSKSAPKAKKTTAAKTDGATKKRGGRKPFTPPCVGSGDKLVILESPNKVASVAKYLGSGWKVMASCGHIREINTRKGQAGRAINKKTWEVDFVVSDSKVEVVKALAAEAKTAKEVYLATDPDREGEAIAWHIYETIKPSTKASFYRLTFNAITQQAIQQAIAKKSQIDMDMVYSQRTRQIMDRLVGFGLSNLVTRGANESGEGHGSAGRVQSVALKFLAERQKEINAFKADEFWEIDLVASLDGFPAKMKLISYKDKPITIPNEKEAVRVCDDIMKSGNAQITEVKEVDKTRKPKPPLTTSTMQQAASTLLGFSVKKTMDVAQSLFSAGHISYHRSDSVRLEADQIDLARNLIEQNFGKNYVAPAPIQYKSKSGGKVQDAHTAIQPTHPENDTIMGASDEKQLYTIIRNRFLACQAATCEYKTKSIVVSVGDYKFRLSGSHILFDGFLKVMGRDDEEDAEENTKVPDVKKNSLVGISKVERQQKFTSPPAYFNDASLVKLMESKGVGRPSTYASIIDKVLERRYVERDGRKLVTTDMGIRVSDFLQAKFPTLINETFTAKMEDQLDEIADQKVVWQQLLNDFWNDLSADIKRVTKELDIPGATGKSCPACDSEVLEMSGRFGKYMKCSNPDCTAKLDKEGNLKVVKEVGTCIDCKSPIVEKIGRYGTFFCCSGYPKCKTIYIRDASTGEFLKKGG
jgi:DNA topoisomerase I